MKKIRVIQSGKKVVVFNSQTKKYEDFDEGISCTIDDDFVIIKKANGTDIYPIYDGEIITEFSLKGVSDFMLPNPNNILFCDDKKEWYLQEIGGCEDFIGRLGRNVWRVGFSRYILLSGCYDYFSLRRIHNFKGFNLYSIC